MKTIKGSEWIKAAGAAAMSSVLLLAGCAGGTATVSTAPQPMVGPTLSGSVIGGRQPIAGANILLYAAGTTGYGSAATNVLTVPVSTGPTGLFTITGNYQCTAGQQMYVASIGGNPGSGVNTNATLLAALGDCANLTSSLYIDIDEITTVGTAFALAPFSAGYANVGTSATNTAGLARAFASVNKLVNITSGQTGGPALAAGAVEPVAEIDTLADVLAACINSSGGTAGNGSVCGSLFSAATPAGGAAPTDTAGAAFDIAQHPGQNVATIYNLSPPIGAPYAPQLTTAPADWTISIHYTTGFNQPKSTTIDANGNVWVANAGSNTVAVLAQTGAPIAGSPFSGNGLSAPSAVAIDSSGDGWVANAGGTTVSAFTSSGGTLPGSPFTAGTAPAALAFDAPGDLWVANSSSNSVTELSAGGALEQTVTTAISAPNAIAIDPR